MRSGRRSDRADTAFCHIECDLIFIEHLPQIADLAAVYRQVVVQIPGLMQADLTAEGVYLGAEAYRRWTAECDA